MNRNPKKKGALKNQQNKKPGGVGTELTQIIQQINATINIFQNDQVMINSSRSNGALLISVDNGAADHFIKGVYAGRSLLVEGGRGMNRNKASIKRYLCVLSKGFTKRETSFYIILKRKILKYSFIFFLLMSRQQPDPHYFIRIKYPNEDDEQK